MAEYKGTALKEAQGKWEADNPDAGKPAEPPPGGVDMDAVKRFAKMTKEKRALEAQVKVLNGRLRTLQEVLVPQFQNASVQNVNAEGATTHLKTIARTSIKPGCEEEALALLEEMGLGDMIKRKANANTLSAAVREALTNEELPANFEQFFKITTHVDLGVVFGG